MPKIAQSPISKVNAYVAVFPEEFMKTPKNELYCFLFANFYCFLFVLFANFCLLLSDAVPYMIAVARALKVLYPQMLHVTCPEHLMHNAAMKVKMHCMS